MLQLDWSHIIHEIEKIRPAMVTQLVISTIPVYFVIVPTMTAVFTAKMFGFCLNDVFLLQHQRQSSTTRFVNAMTYMLSEQGYRMNEKVDKDQLNKILLEPKMFTFMHAHGIDLSGEEASLLFEGGEGYPTIKEFIYGCEWIWSMRKSADVTFLSEQAMCINHDVRCVRRDNRTILNALSKSKDDSSRPI